MNIKTMLKSNFINIPGWHTNRKIIVFESDDWGMIRMASKKAQSALKSKGYPIEKCPYNSNDRFENDDDVEALAEVLLSVKDKLNHPAKFTLNNVVANPDFESIRMNGFRKYYYKSFTETIKEYKDSSNIMSLYRKGIANGVFQPQLHGREHVNIRLWLHRLQSDESKTKEAFNHNMFTLNHGITVSGRRDALDAFGNTTIRGDNFDYEKVLKEAQKIFYETWGFKSESFIAPCYTWHPLIEKALLDVGVNYIQGTHVQRVPIDNESFKIKRKYHYTGQKNKWEQFYLVRNCFFEPTEQGRNNCVENTLKEIERSFTYKKPAIISSHRVNYIGSLNPDNRSENLELLKKLLNKILERWPEVEFMSSDQLGQLIKIKK